MTHDLPAEVPADAIDATKAAQLVRKHVSTIHRWFNTGHLTGCRVGSGKRRRLLVSEASVRAMIREYRRAEREKKPHAQTAAAQQREWTRETLQQFGIKLPSERGSSVGG